MIKINLNDDTLVTKEIFSIPIYEKKFNRHNEFKSLVSNYLFDDTNYKDNTSRETLKFTHANLHKLPEFNLFYEFVKKTVYEVFIDLGYKPNFDITGIWATRHIEGGYHHRHVHNNSFLAGVYYFNGIDSITPGTSFFSPINRGLILPAVLGENSEKIKSGHYVPFSEGKLIVFPSWLEHNTPFNKADSDRIILSFNCMPVGKTNIDPFDRYNYQSIENAELLNYRKEKYT